MIRVVILLLLIGSSLCAEVLDRAELISSRQNNRLNKICEAVKEHSGEIISVVLLSEEDQKRSGKLNLEFAKMLNLQDQKEWILALVSPDGAVQISMSKGVNEKIVPEHSVTLSDGTESIYSTGETARAVEFLLLNICDIVAQEKGVELGALLSGGDFTHEDRSSELTLTAFAIFILGIGTILLYRRFLRNEHGTTELTNSTEFGGAISGGESTLFGISSFLDKEQ